MQLLDLPWLLQIKIISKLRPIELLCLRMTCVHLRAAIQPLTYQELVTVEREIPEYLGIADVEERPWLACWFCVRLRPHDRIYSAGKTRVKELLLANNAFWGRRRNIYCKDCIKCDPHRRGRIELNDRIFVWCALCGRFKPRGGHSWTRWNSACHDCRRRFGNLENHHWVHGRLFFYTSSREYGVSGSIPHKPYVPPMETYTRSIQSMHLSNISVTEADLILGGLLPYSARVPTPHANPNECLALASVIPCEEQTISGSLKPRKYNLQTLPVELQELVVRHLATEERACLRRTCHRFWNMVPPFTLQQLLRAQNAPIILRLDWLGCPCCCKFMARACFGISALENCSKAPLVEAPTSTHSIRVTNKFCMNCGFESLPRVFRYRPGQSIAIGDRLMHWCIMCRQVRPRDPSFCGGGLALGRNGGKGLACETCEELLRLTDERPWRKFPHSQRQSKKEAKMKRLGREHLQRPHNGDNPRFRLRQ